MMAPTHKKKKKSSKQSSIKRLETWLESFDTVSAAVQKHDLVQLLEAGGGITKIKDFLPAFVAEGILETLEQCSDAHWNMTSADDDYTHNNISHEFLSTKSQTLDAIFRVFTLLLPDSLFTFSAAKYCKAGHIKPHDDRAYTQVCMDDGSIQLCSRNIAVIYYLTKDWSAADGGALIDLEAPGGPQTHVPQFNSLISFTIPRWHEVTPVVGNSPRYSVFGWFLEPGKLYELQLDAQPPGQQQPQLSGQQQVPQQERSKKQQGKHKKGKGSKLAKHSNTGAAAQQAHPPQPLLGVHKVKKRKKKTHEQPQQQQLSPQPAAAGSRSSAAPGATADGKSSNKHSSRHPDDKKKRRLSKNSNMPS